MVAVLALLAFAPSSASAATGITVNSTTDAPLETFSTTCTSTDPAEDCTLRAAVELANTESEDSGEQVTVDVPAGVYTEELGSLFIVSDASVAIDGAGAGKTIIDGATKTA